VASRRAINPAVTPHSILAPGVDNQ
jgi:hypothetical protein